MTSREKWSAARLAHTAEQRRKIMACIHRLNAREQRALDAAVLHQGSMTLPRPHVRSQLRAWFRLRWSYLISEYEKVLPHVEELPDAVVADIVREHFMGNDAASAAVRKR